MNLFKESETVKKIIEENAKPQWGSPLDYPPDRAEFEVHRMKSQAVETLKEELKDLLDIADQFTESMLTIHRMVYDVQHEIDSLKFRLNAMLGNEFTSDNDE